MNFEQLFASRAHCMKTSAVREFFKLTEQPDVMSFAGGFPSADFFPMAKVREVMLELLDAKVKRHCSMALQKATVNCALCGRENDP